MYIAAAAVGKKGMSRDKAMFSSEEIQPIQPFPLLSYAWLKASVT